VFVRSFYYAIESATQSLDTRSLGWLTHPPSPAVLISELLHLKDCEQAVVERIEICPRLLENLAALGQRPHRKLAAKDLRAEQREDAEKEEEEDEQRDDGLDRVDQRAQQVLQGLPVPIGEAERERKKDGGQRK
jgi:hypothetical protein